MFNFILRGRGAADNPDDEPVPTLPTADTTNAPPSPALTAEEVRRRRLAKLNGGSDVSTSENTSGELSGTIPSAAVMKTDNSEKEQESSLPAAASAAATTAVPVATTSVGSSLLPPAPPPASIKNTISTTGTTTPSSLQLPTAPAAPGVASRASSSSSTSTMTTSPAKTPNKPPTTMGDMHVLIATNLALESVFLVTFRQEAAHGPIKYIGTGGSGGGSSTVDYLNHTNVSEIVCTLLSEDVVVGGAIGYLLGCYRRLVEKENTVADKVREDLANCRSQVVSFIASSLGEPEMFGPNSEHALSDFFHTLSEDTSPQMPGLLKLLAEELTKQDTMTTVAHQLVQKCFERLDGGWQPRGCWSIPHFTYSYPHFTYSYPLFIYSTRKKITLPPRIHRHTGRFSTWRASNRPHHPCNSSAGISQDNHTHDLRHYTPSSTTTTYPCNLHHHTPLLSTTIHPLDFYTSPAPLCTPSSVPTNDGLPKSAHLPASS